MARGADHSERNYSRDLDRVLPGFRVLGPAERMLPLPREGDTGERSVFWGSLQVSFPSSKEGNSFDQGSPLLMLEREDILLIR